MAPVPPLAAAVLVRAAGVTPGHRVWSAPMVPATNAGATVMVTTLETAGAQALPELARRRKIGGGAQGTRRVGGPGGPAYRSPSHIIGRRLPLVSNSTTTPAGVGGAGEGSGRSAGAEGLVGGDAARHQGGRYGNRNGVGRDVGAGA